MGVISEMISFPLFLDASSEVYECLVLDGFVGQHRATSIFVGGQLDGNWRGISLAHTPGPIHRGEAQ